MKKRNARAVLCTFSVIGFSVMTGTAAMAAEDSDRITIPYLQENAWDELVMTNDYGRDVIGLADHYGLEGVKTTWDDVNLYASENNTSEAMATIDSGTYYPLVAEDGKWLTVQNCADDTACVSSEDVSRVLILDTAVSKDDVYEGAAVPADDSYSEETSAVSRPIQRRSQATIIPRRKLRAMIIQMILLRMIPTADIMMQIPIPITMQTEI